MAKFKMYDLEIVLNFCGTVHCLNNDFESRIMEIVEAVVLKYSNFLSIPPS